MQKPILSVVVALSALACSRGGAETQGVRTSLSGATVRGPNEAASPSRTTDATGPVDPGGRRSDEGGRHSHISGARPTEHGSAQPTGTPGTGTPLPLEPKAAKAKPKPRDDGSASRGAAWRPRELTDADGGWGSRLARARCDRATFCDQVGAGKVYATQDACVAAERERAVEDVAGYPCDAMGSPALIGACLSEVRKADCGDAFDLELSACSASALCGLP